MRWPLLSLASELDRPPSVLSTAASRPHPSLPTGDAIRLSGLACASRTKTPPADAVRPADPQSDVKARTGIEGGTNGLPTLLTATRPLAARRQNRRRPRCVIRRQVMRMEKAVKHTSPTS